jgi:hypothetical protein
MIAVGRDGNTANVIHLIKTVGTGDIDLEKTVKDHLVQALDSDEKIWASVLRVSDKSTKMLKVASQVKDNISNETRKVTFGFKAWVNMKIKDIVGMKELLRPYEFHIYEEEIPDDSGSLATM